MQVAYIFSTTGHTVSYKLQQMILPQLEAGEHGADIVAMFFFDDNTYALQAGNTLGERLADVAAEQDIMLMLYDQCADERGLAVKTDDGYEPTDTVDGVEVGCFPDLYDALAETPPDQVITL